MLVAHNLLVVLIEACVLVLELNSYMEASLKLEDADGPHILLLLLSDVARCCSDLAN